MMISFTSFCMILLGKAEQNFDIVNHAPSMSSYVHNYLMNEACDTTFAVRS